MILTVEIVPKTCWYTNVRSNVSRNEWDRIRKKCYALARYKCKICGSNHAIECHETWEYDDKNHVQKLVGLITLCNRCHTVKHPGLAKILGKGEIVIDQLVKINKMTEDQAIEYLEEAFEIWSERNKYKWTLDISFLENYK